MADEKEPKNAIEGQNEVTANYLFTGKCKDCKKYFESGGKHHCASLNSMAASYKSARKNFDEFADCSAYEQASISNEGKFHHSIIMFIITIAVVIYGLFTRPVEMLQKYWFYGLLSVCLVVIFFIRSALIGNSLLSANVSEKTQKADNFIKNITAIGIFIGYFLYHGGLKTLSSFSVFITWLVLLFVLMAVVKILVTISEFYTGVYTNGKIISTVIVTIIAIIGFAILFALIDYILGLLLMATKPHSLEDAIEATRNYKSSSTGVIPEK